MSKIELVRVAYDVAYAQRSVTGVRERFANDFVWHNRPEFPGRSSYTAEEMPEMWADLDATFSDFELAPLSFEEHGDFVLVGVEISSRLRGSEARLHDTIWHLWLIREDKPHEAWAFSDRGGALRKLESTPSAPSCATSSLPPRAWKAELHPHSMAV